MDISVLCNNPEILHSFRYDYEEPIYISNTSNPSGIIIVIYADGVALDLEIIDKIDSADSEFFAEQISKATIIHEMKLYINNWCCAMIRYTRLLVCCIVV